MTDPKPNETAAAQPPAPNAAALAAAAANANSQPPESTPPTPPSTIMEAADVADSAALQLVTVLLDRDAHTRIPTQVLGYEVPVMIEIYGEDRVFVIEENDFDASNFDVEAAYDSLRTKYRKHEAALKQVYRSLGQFAREIGVKAPAGTTASSRDKQSMQKVRKPAAKKSAAAKR